MDPHNGQLLVGLIAQLPGRALHRQHRGQGLSHFNPQVNFMYSSYNQKLAHASQSHILAQLRERSFGFQRGAP